MTTLQIRLKLCLPKHCTMSTLNLIIHLDHGPNIFLYFLRIFNVAIENEQHVNIGLHPNSLRFVDFFMVFYTELSSS